MMKPAQKRPLIAPPIVASIPGAIIPRMRRCLMCRLEFPSDWPGERVCRKCKTRPSWHGGAKWPWGIRAI